MYLLTFSVKPNLFDFLSEYQRPFRINLKIYVKMFIFTEPNDRKLAHNKVQIHYTTELPVT